MGMHINGVCALLVLGCFAQIYQFSGIELNCPATTHDCKCRVKYGRLLFMICNIQMGNEIPVFSASDSTLNAINIRSSKSIRELRRNSFKVSRQYIRIVIYLKVSIIRGSAYTVMIC